MPVAVFLRFGKPVDKRSPWPRPTWSRHAYPVAAFEFWSHPLPAPLTAVPQYPHPPGVAACEYVTLSSRLMCAVTTCV